MPIPWFRQFEKADTPKSTLHGESQPFVSYYDDPETEYRRAREQAILIDTSFYGTLQLQGRHTLSLLHRLTTQDIQNMTSNTVQQTVLTSDRGRIVDLLRVFHGDQSTTLRTSAERSATIAQWLDKYIIMDDVRINDISDSTSSVFLIGPRAAQVLIQIGITIPDTNVFLKEGDIIYTQCAAYPNNGFEFFGPTSVIEALCEKLLPLAQPCGRMTYETVRIEDAIPAYHFELSENYNPLEAGLVGAISFTKGCYIGQEVIARLDSREKVQRQLITFKTEKEVAYADKVFLDNKEIGLITGACYSYRHHSPIARAYVKTDSLTDDAAFFVMSGSEKVAAARL